MRRVIKDILFVGVLVCMSIALLVTIIGVIGIVQTYQIGTIDLAFAAALFSVVSGLTSIGSLVVAIFTIVNDSVSNVRTYYEAVEDEKIVKARHLLYKYRDFMFEEGYLYFIIRSINHRHLFSTRFFKWGQKQLSSQLCILQKLSFFGS